jgi:hypothetical protein
MGFDLNQITIQMQTPSFLAEIMLREEPTFQAISGRKIFDSYKRERAYNAVTLSLLLSI